ncbi:MAG TPA: hypothetical protein VF688_02985 [Allosphingosinicella sp.]|jgi:hypothetical protein
MTGESDEDLPLHNEAKARSKWRGGETILDRDDSGTGGPASEIDNASQGGQQAASSEDGLLTGLAKRPPD